MTRDTRSTLNTVLLSLTLLGATVIMGAGCGDDKKTEEKEPEPRQDAGDPEPVDSGGGMDAPPCDGDDPKTPGVECAAQVSCGGSLEAPEVCPKATHSCCVSGFPSEENVNCYEGKSACPAAEAQTPCDGPEDCGGGQVCCVSPPSAMVITECRAATDCDEQAEGTMFCHTDDDCPGGRSCTPPPFAKWWGFCS